MEYRALVDVYERLAATDATTEKREILAKAFGSAQTTLDRVVTLVRGRLGPAHDQVELGVSSSLTLAAVQRATGATEAAIRERWRDTGDLGDAAAWAAEHGGQQTLVSTTLTVERVHDQLRSLATYEGTGSQDRRVETLAGLIADAEPREARYVVRTALGHLRIGVGEGLIRDAIATAFLEGDDAAVTAVERAYQVTNDYQVVARTARAEGRAGLAALDVELGRPVQAMLAEKAESLADGLESAAEHVRDVPEEPPGAVRCEVKYDGIRIQIHVTDDDIRLFTRRLEDVTAQFPDAVRAIDAGVTADRAILDGELVGYTPDSIEKETRRTVPFQRLSQRIKREEEITETAREVPVVVHLFDCLYDGTSLVDEPLAGRLAVLGESYDAVDPELEVPRGGLEHAAAVWAGPTAPTPAEQLYEDALQDGHEGLVLKDPTAAYEPGRRVGRLLKVKPTMEPLDLVVTRAMYSEGRRSDLLGRLYLGCRDEDTGELREVGRLSTGYTDEELAALTDRLEELVIDREGRSVDLEPEVVLEVEYEEIQQSPEYGSGYALRFPRFLDERTDLEVMEADSLERIEALYDRQ
ncbi:MAG: ATP-dependent DNA ligase [Halobacteriaceae archaeon]